MNNITFKDSIMPETVKGIYMKSRWSDSAPVGDDVSISDIYYTNITIILSEKIPSSPFPGRIPPNAYNIAILSLE